MRRGFSGSDREALDAVLERIQAWRRERIRRCPMPAALWEQAVEQARLLGVHRVSRTLRVDYHSLKRRAVSPVNVQPMRSEAAVVAPAFIEVAIGSTGPAFGCVVEMQHADGARMTIRMTAAAELVGLASAFWSQRRSR